MEDDRERILRFLDAAKQAVGTDLSGLARKAGVFPSTLTRFVNKADVKHILSTRTLDKLTAASGVAYPGAREGLPMAARIAAVSAVAKVLGVQPDQLSSERLLTERALEWLDIIDRLPDDSEELLFGAAQGLAGGAPKQQRKPRETSRVWRKG